MAVESVERRTRERVRVALEVSAWSPQDPARLVVGETVDLTTGGSLLRLPGLSAQAAVIDLRITLPSQMISARAGVLRRQVPDLYSVVFEKISPEAQAQLADFLRQSSVQAAEEAFEGPRRRKSLLRRKR